MLQDNTIKSVKPLRKPDIAIHHVDNEAILYRNGERTLHVLNPTARLVWELCDGTHTVEDMERSIRASFSVADGCDVARDIRQTIDDFARKGVLEG
ncbi:MAG: PqqD family protein [Candidatus Brocadia sp.]|nr:PqqD family protein [Candidatus Brocadia sp.]